MNHSRKCVPIALNGILALPLCSGQTKRNTEVGQSSVCPIPDTQILELGTWLSSNPWRFLSIKVSPAELGAIFKLHTSELVELF